ncbi:uncharacterized protein [Venturia canescens]|nr:uncharacterized protein LOC122414231 isoform X2 [Venturia canescens]
MCHPCNYKLEEFHKFYEDCLKTDASLKSQLSWMQGSEIREEIIVPMVQINNMKIKSEPFDYEEQGLTEAVFNAENMENYEQNNYLFDDKFLRISDTRCSRCGCFCGNQNYGNSETSKKCSTLRESRQRRGTIANDPGFPARDMIRRNLFATEIFDKNSTLRTEIPLCGETKVFFQEKSVENAVDLFAGSDRLKEQPRVAVVTPKIEISKVPNPPTRFTRVLRPRKRLAKNLPKSRSSSDPTKKSNKSTSREIRRNRAEADVPMFLEIKSKAADECERSLRPRQQLINYYAESRRRVPRVRIEKMKIPLDDARLQNLKKEIVSEATHFPKPNFIQKFEPDDDTSKIETNKTKTSESTSRNSLRKTLSVKIKKEIIVADLPDLMPTRKRVTRSASRSPLSKDLKNKALDKSKRKNSPKSRRELTLCLRSQIGSLRRNKSRKFDLFFDGSEKAKDKNTSSRNHSSSTIRTKSIEISARDPATIFRYHDCAVCEKRFASQELYKLHDCYNKRH